MDKKTKTESFPSPLRTPKPKSKLGLKVPQILMPHDQIIRAQDEEIKPELRIVSGGKNIVNHSETNETTTLPSHTRQTTHTRQTKHISETEVAPTKNYQKVANSITKQAVPEGWFKGKSKQLYDALYSLTRGAIVPVRKIRVQKGKLMKLAGIGSRITFDSNIRHLVIVGLIRSTVLAGEHGGNEFEVFLPEEITLPSQSSQTSESSMTSHAQKVDTLVSLENSQTSQSSEVTNTGTSNALKTFSKTLSFKIDDDAPVVNLLEKLNEAARKVTGKDLTKKDLEKLSDLSEILIAETVIAAARTGAVSALVPFMMENLRRRLYSKPRIPKKQEKETRWQDIGKNDQTSESGDWEQRSLTEQERSETLEAYKMLLKSGKSGVLDDLKAFGELEYTPEDYQWLLGNLEKGS